MLPLPPGNPQRDALHSPGHIPGGRSAVGGRLRAHPAAVAPHRHPLRVELHADRSLRRNPHRGGTGRAQPARCTPERPGSALRRRFRPGWIRLRGHPVPRRGRRLPRPRAPPGPLHTSVLAPRARGVSAGPQRHERPRDRRADPGPAGRSGGRQVAPEVRARLGEGHPDPRHALLPVQPSRAGGRRVDRAVDRALPVRRAIPVLVRPHGPVPPRRCGSPRSPASRSATSPRPLCASFPSVRPYGGQFDRVIPHLTVADRVTEPTMDRLEAAIAPSGSGELTGEHGSTGGEDGGEVRRARAAAAASPTRSPSTAAAPHPRGSTPEQPPDMLPSPTAAPHPRGSTLHDTRSSRLSPAAPHPRGSTPGGEVDGRETPRLPRTRGGQP